MSDQETGPEGPREVRRAGTPTTLGLLVTAGVGICATTEGAHLPSPGSLTFVRLDPEHLIPLTLVWDSKRESAAVRTVVSAASRLLH